MLDVITEPKLRAALRPQHSHVCFAIGAHGLPAWTGPDFEERLHRLIDLFSENNRRLLLMTTPYWASKKDLRQPDAENNAVIRQLNDRLKQVAEHRGIPVFDFCATLSAEPYADYVHFRHASYNAPADALKRWFLSAGTGFPVSENIPDASFLPPVHSLP